MRRNLRNYFTSKSLVSDSVAVCGGGRKVCLFCGERIEIPSNFQLLLSISSFSTPSTRLIPARKNHFLPALSKITLPERDGPMHERFKQRHSSNASSNKVI